MVETENEMSLINKAIDEVQEETKKKKKKKKNKKKNSGLKSYTNPCKLPPFRGVKGYTDSYVKCNQTEPPSIPVVDLFPDGKFPVGEIQDHPGDFNTYRTTDEEKRALDRANEELYKTLRHASEVHRQVRKYAQSFIQPGIKLADMCERLEEKNRELVGEAGFAVSINTRECL